MIDPLRPICARGLGVVFSAGALVAEVVRGESDKRSASAMMMASSIIDVVIIIGVRTSLCDRSALPPPSETKSMKQ